MASPSQTQQVPFTNQETAARGSYISLAANVTAKFKCCNTSDNITETNHQSNGRNTGASDFRSNQRAPLLETLPEIDVPIIVDPSPRVQSQLKKSP